MKRPLLLVMVVLNIFGSIEAAALKARDEAARPMSKNETVQAHQAIQAFIDAEVVRIEKMFTPANYTPYIAATGAAVALCIYNKNILKNLFVRSSPSAMSIPAPALPVTPTTHVSVATVARPRGAWKKSWNVYVRKQNKPKHNGVTPVFGTPVAPRPIANNWFLSHMENVASTVWNASLGMFVPRAFDTLMNFVHSPSIPMEQRFFAYIIHSKLTDLMKVLLNTGDAAYMSGYIQQIKSPEEETQKTAQCIQILIQNSLHVAAFMHYYHKQIGDADALGRKETRIDCLHKMVEFIALLKELQQHIEKGIFIIPKSADESLFFQKLELNININCIIPFLKQGV